jgi:hypothetical protein
MSKRISAKVEKKMKIRLLILNVGLALILAGCASGLAPSAPTRFQPVLTATVPPHPTASPYPTWLPPSPRPTSDLPAFAPASEPLGSIQVSPSVSYITIDEVYLYWTIRQQEEKIFRAPLAGGEIEVVANSHYKDGRLSDYPPIRSNDWLVFIDTPASEENVTWKVRALNLSDGKEQVVIEDVRDLDSWPGPDLDMEVDWIVWARGQHVEAPDCSTLATLAMRNLKTGESRELECLCAQNNYMPMFPQLSNGYLVYERDLPDNKGRGNDIYLYELQSGELITLTTNHRGSMPDISYPWVVWKDSPRFGDEDDPTVVYDLRSGQRTLIKVPGDGNPDPHVSGHWLYWSAELYKPLYVYDLETGQLHNLAVPGPGESLESVSLSGAWAAWDHDMETNKSVSQHFIEWRTLPDANSERK